MAVTKFTVSLSLTLAHPDGIKLRKKDVASYLKTLLEGDDGTDRMRSSKVVIRAVDLD